MQGIDLNTGLQTQQDKRSSTNLSRLAHRWDHTIRHELHRLGEKCWPTEHFWEVFPLYRYRIRRQFEPGIYIWWVEHDIPPYDRYRCAAYLVELSLSSSDQPQLIVYSGSAGYPVDPLSSKGLRTAIDKISTDPPLVIHRQFGPARYP